MTSATPVDGTVAMLARHLGGIDDEFVTARGHLPVLLCPVPGGPAWRYDRAGLVSITPTRKTSIGEHVVVTGTGLADPVGPSASVDGCLEQIGRSRAAGDLTAAAQWAQTLAAALLAETNNSGRCVGHGAAQDDAVVEDGATLAALARRPPAIPEVGERGVSLEAGFDRTYTAFDLAGAILAGRPVISTVADLVGVLDQLPGETTVVIDDQVRVPRGVTLGEDAVLVVVAELIQVVHDASHISIRDDDGTEYGVLDPAIQLGLQWLPDPSSLACPPSGTPGLPVPSIGSARLPRLAGSANA